MNPWQKLLVDALIRIILEMMTPDRIKSFVSLLIQYAEDYILGTETKVDDRFVLPLIERLKEAFDL